MILPICIYKLGFGFSPIRILMLLVQLISSTAIYVSIMMIFASISFWVEDRQGFLEPIATLRIFGKYPMDIYGPVLRIVLTWILPFGFTAFYPSAYFIKDSGFDYTLSYFTPLVAVICFLLSKYIFNLGLDQYEGVGN